MRKETELFSSKVPQRYSGVENRVQVVALGLAVAFGLLCIQFWRLQVVHHREYVELAEENRVRLERLKSDRGVIYGRDGVVLADNRASADIVLVPGDCPEAREAQVCATLEGLLDVPADGLLERIEAHRHEPFTQIPVKRDVSKAERVRIEEHSYALPGVITVVRPQRRYLFGSVGGQVLGYVGEINPSELEELEGYHMGDLIGRGGLEQQYEPLLHGEDGYMVVTKYASGRPQLRTDKTGMPYIAQRDSRGHLLREEKNLREDPTPGHPLHLTLDIGLQAHCETLLAGEVGAIAVLAAETGEVLALASSPGYDPSVFVNRGHNRERLALLTADDPNPMFHRAYRENYPPGSVFKVMLAAAALECGVITPETTFYCPGFFQIDGKGRRWHCWKRHGHGRMGVVEALAFSCDVFFYNVGLELGVDRIAEWSHKLGLGVKTGIDLPGEVPGLIPDRAWKAEMHADEPPWEQRWYRGETVNLSIGQGSANATPLQNAVLMACIVNDGYRVRPYLNAALGPKRSERLLSDATLAIVREGMQLCVEKGPPAPTGTGHRAQIPGMRILGKTGSAQVMSLHHHEEFETEEDIPYNFRDHAWFVAGVLDREPPISICVLVEHGHHGSSVAAPLAREVITFFYADNAEREVLLAREGVHLPLSEVN